MIGGRKIFAVLLFLSFAAAAAGQADRRDVRAGNRKFRREKFKEAEIDYRKAVLKDSSSLAAQYNLASSLYRQEDYDGAQKALSAVAGEGMPARYHYNAGDVALKRKDYASAVKSFREALLIEPDDMDAKENYIYAKKMLENQQNGGDGQGNDGNQGQQDQEQNQNGDGQNQPQDSPQNQPQDNSQDEGEGQQPQGGISPQQAQQMLKAVEAKENETRDKVDKEKAALLQSRQKEKNW